MFKNILVVNRGEIACRIIRTAQDMGIEAHAIFHHADRNAPHVALADLCHEVDSEVPVAAYLDIDQILKIAKNAEIESIHPGYGFLSENHIFAQRVEEEGINFIGPTGASMTLLGDKIRSREVAIKADVPVSASAEYLNDEQALVDECRKIGFPLLLKASAGGGGKGMQIVNSPGELGEKIQLSRGEAERYFGDNRIYAETYISKPRHIEVQILGDGNGDVIHLFERECSIQRRFQKIIEESPAPNLDRSLKEKICVSACELAKSLNYRNAGTVEFIVSEDNQYYFLEMNTRLQVEHPVTELVCDLDLVREQLLIAVNGKLSHSQNEIIQRGHAIESRICCEDPNNNFAPATGKIQSCHLPSIENTRYDIGFSEGQEITSDFDSMIGKLICYGTDRHAAIQKSIESVGKMHILGIDTNLNFLLAIFRSEAFSEGLLHTGFISENQDALTNSSIYKDNKDIAAIVATLEDSEVRHLMKNSSNLHRSIGSWRN